MSKQTITINFPLPPIRQTDAAVLLLIGKDDLRVWCPKQFYDDESNSAEVWPEFEWKVCNAERAEVAQFHGEELAEEYGLEYDIEDD